MSEYLLETRGHVDKIFKKLAKKNPHQMESNAEKIDEIFSNPHRFKPLHFPLAGMHPVHFGKLLLMYSIDESRKTVVIED